MSLIGRIIGRKLGRGEHAITVPILDGPLLPNQALEAAEVVAELPDADNLCATDRGLYATSAAQVLRLGPGAPEVVFRAPAPVSALTAGRGMLAIGVEGGGGGGGGVTICGGPYDGRHFAGPAGRPFGCITALAFLDAETLLLTQGSAQNPASGWRRDLMERRSSGSLWRLGLQSGEASCIAEGLAWAGGVAVTGSQKVYVAESWRHRVLAVDLGSGARQAVLDHLPAYPARIVAAVNAGYWLSFFSIRNQLVEFILREDAYRARMLAEVPEDYWMAPALRSGQSFREPMQGSQLKQMGVLKPYAVSRSYGLVAYCDGAMQPRHSFQSRSDGRAHGTVSACEQGDDLFVAARGPGLILRLPGVAAGE